MMQQDKFNEVTSDQIVRKCSSQAPVIRQISDRLQNLTACYGNLLNAGWKGKESISQSGLIT